MTEFLIPLTPEPQAFGITLAGRELRLTVRWFDSPEGGWLLDIATADNAEPIVSGIPLVAGSNMLAPYEYLGFNGELWIGGNHAPALDNLGETVQLFFVTAEDA